jgi:hypothetical protein
MEKIDINLLLDSIDKYIPQSAKLVGIDGVDGVGKTPLAKALALRENGTVLSLDDYLIKHREEYVNSLKPNLVQDLEALSGFVVVEGVCLQAVAKKFSLFFDFIIYLKKTHLGIWADEDKCDFESSPEKVIKKDEDDLFIFCEWERYSKGLPPPNRAEIKLSGLRKELIYYHYEFKPHVNSHLILGVNHA